MAYSKGDEHAAGLRSAKGLVGFTFLPAESKSESTRMWADTQRDGRPAEYKWRRLFNAAKFG